MHTVNFISASLKQYTDRIIITGTENRITSTSVLPDPSLGKNLFDFEGSGYSHEHSEP